MGFLVSNKPVRVQLEDDDNWIDVKAKLSAGDRAKLQDGLLMIERTTSDVRVQSGGYLVTLMEIAFIDWHIVEDGEEVPFAKKTISQIDLDHPLVEAACDKIAELNPTLTGAAQKM